MTEKREFSHLRPATGKPGKAFVVFLGKRADTARRPRQRRAGT